MTREELINYCKSKKGATVEFPFDDRHMSFKLISKFFAFIDTKNERNVINLKCDPLIAVALREQYEGVKPGFHMNKKHWNTIDVNVDIPREKVYEMIDMSYSLIYISLKKLERKELESIEQE